jgi:hypothetical protein
MCGLSQFIGIHFLPLALIVTDKIPASSPTVDAGILCAGRRNTLVAQGARRHQKASARSVIIWSDGARCSNSWSTIGPMLSVIA